MKYSLIIPVFLILLSAAGCALFEPENYSVGQEDSGNTLSVKTGDMVIVTLPAEKDPDCFWKPASPVNSMVLLRTDLRKGMSRKGENGPEFYAVQYYYRVIGPGYSGISLERQLPVKGDEVRQKERFDLLVRSEGKRLRPQSVFEKDENPAPETMTDSKGNVHLKPKNLLD